MLRLHDVETYYGRIRALKGLSLQVPAGAIVAVLGANGAGKSTTLRTISGLLQPAAGSIEFEGHRIDRLPVEKIVRLGISHVPEGRQIFTNLTVMENLRLGAYVRKDRSGTQKDLERVMDHFPVLGERQRQLAGTLSGGEQQMLAIARALMTRPRLLLLDEPSLGLAPLLVNEIFRIIKTINEEGTTVLLVEQNASVALSIAHFGYVLEAGRVALSDKAENLRENQWVRRSYLGC